MSSSRSRNMCTWSLKFGDPVPFMPPMADHWSDGRVYRLTTGLPRVPSFLEAARSLFPEEEDAETPAKEPAP